MCVLSTTTGIGERNLRAKGRAGRTRWALGAAAIVIGMVAVGPAHAQDCDPVEIAKMLADDGAEFDYFGSSISVSGDTAIIGARLDDDNGNNSGSAYVFTRSGGVWTQQAKLLPDDGAEDDRFGWAAAISGDTAIIGAYQDDDNGADSGSAYIFTRSGGVWTQQAKLLPDGGGEGDQFGWSVALSGDTAVVGAFWADSPSFSGSVYVFTRSGGGGGVWTQQAKLLPDGGVEDDGLGQSVSVSGDTVVIGASLDDDNGLSSGSAYVFTRSGGLWTQQAKLLASDGEEYAQFGDAISYNGDTAVISASWSNEVGNWTTGSAYVFTRSGSVWTQQARLLPSDWEQWELGHMRFGGTVAHSDDIAVIGAFWDDENDWRSGSAYVFSRSGGVWTQQAKLLPDDGEKNDLFGWAVALGADSALIGTPRDDDVGSSSGSVYVYDLNCEDCPADLNSDGSVNSQDFLAFLNLWNTGDPTADWNEDGDVNTLDFLAYLADWTAGC